MSVVDYSDDDLKQLLTVSSLAEFLYLMYNLHEKCKDTLTEVSNLKSINEINMFTSETIKQINENQTLIQNYINKLPSETNKNYVLPQLFSKLYDNDKLFATFLKNYVQYTQAIKMLHESLKTLNSNTNTCDDDLMKIIEAHANICVKQIVKIHELKILIEQKPVVQEVKTDIVKPEPVSAPVAEPVSAPVAEPVAAPVAAPASVVEPVAAPVAAPASVAEPVSAPVAASVAEPVSAPVAEPVSTPVTEPVARPVSAPVSEPVSEPVSAPITAPVAEPVSESAPTPVLEDVNVMKLPVKLEELTSSALNLKTEENKVLILNSGNKIGENLEKFSKTYDKIDEHKIAIMDCLNQLKKFQCQGLHVDSAITPLTTQLTELIDLQTKHISKLQKYSDDFNDYLSDFDKQTSQLVSSHKK